MGDELQIFKNPEFGSVRTVEISGKTYFVATDIAKALGYSNPRDAIWRHCKGVVKHDGVSKTTNQHGITTEQKVEFNVIPEGDIYRLVIKSQLPSADKFESWIFNEVLPQIRMTGTYSLNKSSVEQGISVVKFIADDLRVNTASRILMYENYCKDVGIPTGFLPKYEHNGSREMKALTHLLKENNCELKAAKFNALLIEHGFLEEKERPSSKGGTKKYKRLTEKGLKYGENAVNPHNQKEVQPLYYADTFMELYKDMVHQ